MWGGQAAEELNDMEGCDWLVGALCWRRHQWDGIGVLVAFVVGNCAPRVRR